MTSLKKLTPPPYTTVQPGVLVQQDFGASTFENVGPPVETKVRRLEGREVVAAGLTTTKRNYHLWAELPIEFTESVLLKHPDEGNLDVVSITPYPERGIVQITADRTV